MRKFPKGCEILEQEKNFKFFCILTKGMAKVTKFADQGAQVERSILNLKKQLKKLKIGYKFHHTMVDRASTKSDSSGYFDIEGDPKPFTTISENKVTELETEIARLEKKLSKINIDASNGGESNKRLEIGTLVSGDIFGEMSVLEPFNSVGRGGVQTETNVEVFMVHQSVLQRYPYTCTDKFRKKVEVRAPEYPVDSRIVASVKYVEEWKGYRSGVMRGIKKTRWPINRRRIREVRRGTIITADLETKYTKENVGF